jgi:hypothetical protein
MREFIFPAGGRQFCASSTLVTSSMQNRGKDSSSHVAAFPVDPILAAAHERHLKKVLQCFHLRPS